jgi:hypothetical protein
VSDLDPTLNAILEAARPELGPTSSQRARMRADFGQRVPPDVLAATMPTAKVAVAAGVAGVVAGTGTGAAAPAAGGIAKALAILSLLGATGGIGYAIHASKKPSPSATSTSTALPAAAVPDDPQPPPADTAVLTPSTSTALAQDTKPAHLARRLTPHVCASSTSAATSANDLADELALVSRAQAALAASDPTAALALLDAHAARYPKGQLTEEREALRVICGCSLGNATARRKADQLLKRHPESPLAARIRKACGGS